MKIYTGKGDEGYTSLLGGSRVSKDDLQIEAYGTVDELNSWIGILAVEPLLNTYKSILQNIQHRLFDIGSILAKGDRASLMNLPSINEEHIQILEDAMDGMTAALPELTSFILPGSGQVNAKTHVGRTVCRRAERRVVAMNQFESIDSLILIYLNRLSDFLFVLGRMATHLAEEEEVKWSPS
ncbi:MAG: cob(I)yrinic acid a,c-diamide adenosyltransferase [Bacteroidota bacterium]